MDPMTDPAAMDRYERALRRQGFLRVAGVDEAGRGALAGPMVAAAVILPDGFDLEGIRDSKQLTPKQRDESFGRIHRDACVAVVKVTPAAIDKRGLHRCNISLLRSAACDLAPAPDYVLTDGFAPPRMPFPTLAVKKGDAVSASIAAASIIAKVTRDRIMDELHRRYPDFGFDRNKGYGTDDHLEAIDRLGPTQIHRYSFAGVGQAALPGVGRGVVAPA
jgi:ribonuclease HII